MNLFSAPQIKLILEKYGAKPSKGMGQNFLVDAKTLNTIIEAAGLTKKDTVLEIGPGIGTLTQALAQNAGQVVAIEKDPVMLNILQETVGNYKNIELIHDDALKVSIINYQLSNYKVVANIPYYITSPIIRKFLETPNPPSEIILMVQKEVAERICAKPPKMSLLAVSVQCYATAKIISRVSKGNFWPVPSVDSAIIKITPKQSVQSPTLHTSLDFRDIFFKMVKAGFLHPRKQLGGNLATALKKDKESINAWLLKNNIKPTRRAETLTIQDWINLTNTFT